jgi:hypothetical protein
MPAVPPFIPPAPEPVAPAPPLGVPPVELPLAPPVDVEVPPLPDVTPASLEPAVPPLDVLVPPDPALPGVNGAVSGSGPPHASASEITPSARANRAPAFDLRTTTEVMRTARDLPPRVELGPVERNE